MARFVVTSRVGPKVTRTRFATLDEALAHITRCVQAGAPHEPGRRVLGRDYAPERQVAGRHEVRGPGVRGGIDVRGDGSAEAYRGWIRKELVARRDGESAVDALARALRG